MSSARDPEDQLAAIERKLDELEATLRLLWGHRLIADGHAADFRQAREISTDPERLRALYPEAFDAGA